MGAAGRDFHNFNVLFKHREDICVRYFTAAQIPDIDDRLYPTELAGPLYPKGIPIEPEDKLKELILDNHIHDVYFSYSDISHETLMKKASQVMSWGANFILLGPNETTLKSKKPVISVCAVRTGCGKSQTTRKVATTLQALGFKAAAIRHPMPYGDLTKQMVQEFLTIDDLKKHNCTIEEMEEYEPHINSNIPVYAGVDYQKILLKAEQNSDIIIWDGGNNDTPFIKSDFEIVVVDPHRAGHEINYYPGEVNFRRADLIIINKIDTADLHDILEVRENIHDCNPDATVIDAASPVLVDNPEAIRNKNVLVIEDGPTLTHGEMQYGAGIMAAFKFGAKHIVDPREWATGSILHTFEVYPEIGTLLPAMGYGAQQIKDLEETINRIDCDLVIVATPINLSRIMNINKPTVRVFYELQEIGQPTLKSILEKKFKI
jgi:predicted GTPase